MIDTKQHRINRIDTLLYELKYEVTRGIMEGDVEETMGYEFAVPVSHCLPGGVVLCEFRTRPVQHYILTPDTHQPKLRIVK